MNVWVDTHCHLDAPEFAPDALTVRAHAAGQGVAHCVLPAVEVASFDAVRRLAPADLAAATTRNAMAALPRLGALLPG